MTSPQSEVDPEQLRTHASRLNAHADQLSSIGSGLPGEMGAQSLGMFAQFITTGLGSAMTETMGAFAHASSTLDKVGDGLRRAADQYEHTDEGHGDRIAGIEEGGR